MFEAIETEKPSQTPTDRYFRIIWPSYVPFMSAPPPTMPPFVPVLLIICRPSRSVWRTRYLAFLAKIFCPDYGAAPPILGRTQILGSTVLYICARNRRYV